MSKPALLLCLCLLIPCLLPARTSHAAGEAVQPDVTAPEAIVIDGWSGSVLYAKSDNVPRYPASCTKIMTALVMLKHHIPMRRIVMVSANAVSFGSAVGATTAGLYAGEHISMRNLLYGMLLPSGNDAAAAVAEATGGSVDHFVEMMNVEARRLHLWHTHFKTPNGFDVWGQVTTARDLANLARAAMRFSAFRWVVRQRWWNGASADGQSIYHWENTNKLLWQSAAVDGIKTGTTPGAGANLVSSAIQGGKWVIEVNMGSTEYTRFADGMALLRYGLLVDSGVPSAR